MKKEGKLHVSEVQNHFSCKIRCEDLWLMSEMVLHHADLVFPKKKCPPISNN